MTLNFTAQGNPKNPALVFLHAFPFTGEMWHDQQAEFAEHFHCLSPDLPGFGESASPQFAFTFEHYVDATLAFLTDQKIDKAIWCGLSMGGYLALRMYEKAPQHCRALILCDTKSGADSNEAKLKRWAGIEAVTKNRAEWTEAQLKALVGESNQQNAELKMKIKNLIGKSKSDGITAGMVALATRTDTTESLKKINVPTLLVVGKEDKVTPPSEAQAMNEAISKSKLEVLEKSGHLSSLETPSEFNRCVSSFLKTI